MKNKFIIILTGLILLFTLSLGVSAQDVTSTIIKDETVYMDLNSDGSIKEVLVVNHIITPTEGTYVDYGDYAAIENITGKEKPTVAGNKITWQLPANPDGFYYIGTLKKADIPWNFNIKYYLENKEVDASALGGISGKVKIKVSATSNKIAGNYFKENFAMQMSQTLNTDMCKNINAVDGTTVVAGKNETVSFMVLPGTNTDATISFDATDLELAGLSVILSPFSMSGFGGMEDLEGGVDEMINAMDALISGTNQLKSGMVTMSDGVGSLSSGAQQLANANGTVEEGFNQYQQGLSTFGNYISSFSAEMSKSLDSLAGAGKKLETAKSALNQSTKKINEALNNIDSNIGSSKQQIEQLEQGLNQLSAGLKDLSSGMAQIIEQNNKIGAQLTGLSNQYSGLQGQYAELSSKLNGIMNATDTATALKDNPDPEVAKLANAYLSAAGSVTKVKGELDALNSGFKQLNSTFGGAIESISQGYAGLNSGITKLQGAVDDMLKGLSAGFDFSGIKTQLTTLQAEMKNAQNTLGQFSMDDFNIDVNQYKNGMTQMDQAVSGLEYNFSLLKDGVTNQVFSGINQLNEGLSLLYTNVYKLPGVVDKLADGQTQVRDGVNNSFKDYLGNDVVPDAVSFASPGSLVPRTIQFIGTTPTIAVDKTVYVAPVEKKLTLLDRVKNMFD
ncbi:MAG: hypothetical protein RR385_07790 [Clostridiales bacterium]